MILATHFGPTSTSGNAIRGEQLVRMVYIDEAGTSPNEEVAVCAGIIVNPDKQWRVLEAFMKDIISEHFGDLPINTIFHAKDVWHGSGVFSREKYSKETRHKAILAAVHAYQKCEMTFSIGYCKKSTELNGREQQLYKHTTSYLFAIQAADMFLDDKNELATIVAEDEPSSRNDIKGLHEIAKGNLAGIDWISRNELPYVMRRIIDTVHFAAKKENPILQFADVFAFIFRRFLEGKEDVAECVSVFSDEAIRRAAFDDQSAGYFIFTNEIPEQDSSNRWNVSYTKAV